MTRRLSRNGVTLRHVAEQAGVSRQTVSNALNAPGRLHPATLQRVLEVVGSLGYRPNQNARGLRTSAPGALGLCISAGSHFLSLERLLPALSAAAAASDRKLMVFTAPTGVAGMPTYEDLVSEGSVDGFVLTGVERGDDRPVWLDAEGLPFVTLGRTGEPDQPSPWVDVDTAAGVAEAVTQLHRRGHTTIGLLAGSSDPAMDEAIAGWRRACGQLGLSHDRGLVARGGATVAAGRRAAERLLSRADPPTALVATSDQLAIGATQACTDRGIIPGREAGLIGFGDTPLAATVPGGLTSVRAPVEGMAWEALRLLDAAGVPDVPQHRLLPPELVLRGSS